MTEHPLATVPALWASPDPSTISRLPKGGVMLDYMGHAEVTLALIDVDPGWTFEPAAIDLETGGPKISRQGDRLVVWGHLTLHGVSRLCVGTCEARKFEPEKELLGDALRNGAMRFGIGTKLWSKAEAAETPLLPQKARPAPSAPSKSPKPSSAATAPPSEPPDDDDGAIYATEEQRARLRELGYPNADGIVLAAPAESLIRSLERGRRKADELQA
jgi:hypothetical protein